MISLPVSNQSVWLIHSLQISLNHNNLLVFTIQQVNRKHLEVYLHIICTSKHKNKTEIAVTS